MGEVLLAWEFLVGVCHPDPISDQKKYHFLHPFSDLTSKIHTHFQTSRLGRSYVIITQIRAQTKNFFKCILNSLISSSFLFIWNWNDKYVHKTIPNSRLKWAKCIALFQTKKAQKPYPLGTYPHYMTYISVPPSPGQKRNDVRPCGLLKKKSRLPWSLCTAE